MVTVKDKEVEEEEDGEEWKGEEHTENKVQGKVKARNGNKVKMRRKLRMRKTW